mmetsp:Transcript_33374/g.84559  ORF Transcript_33374/g.84559 Transcript_33374/m.84559 type:complete len:361 (+) Transcript_33374:1445-2527(+)
MVGDRRGQRHVVEGGYLAAEVVHADERVLAARHQAAQRGRVGDGVDVLGVQLDLLDALVDVTVLLSVQLPPQHLAVCARAEDLVSVRVVRALHRHHHHRLHPVLVLAEHAVRGLLVVLPHDELPLPRRAQQHVGAQRREQQRHAEAVERVGVTHVLGHVGGRARVVGHEAAKAARRPVHVDGRHVRGAHGLVVDVLKLVQQPPLHAPHLHRSVNGARQDAVGGVVVRHGHDGGGVALAHALEGLARLVQLVKLVDADGLVEPARHDLARVGDHDALDHVAVAQLRPLERLVHAAQDLRHVRARARPPRAVLDAAGHTALLLAHLARLPHVHLVDVDDAVPAHYEEAAAVVPCQAEHGPAH